MEVSPLTTLTIPLYLPMGRVENLMIAELRDREVTDVKVDYLNSLLVITYERRPLPTGIWL